MRRNKSPTVIHAGKNPTIISPGNKPAFNKTVCARVGTVFVREEETNENLSVNILVDKDGSVKFDHPACSINGYHRAKVDHNPASSPNSGNEVEHEKRFSEVLGSDFETKMVEILGKNDLLDFFGLKIKEDCDVFVTLIFLKKETFKDRADITELEPFLISLQAGDELSIPNRDEAWSVDNLKRISVLRGEDEIILATGTTEVAARIRLPKGSFDVVYHSF